MIKTLLISIILLTLSIVTWAQGTVSGTLKNKDTKEVLGLSTVSVYKAIDTVLITYRLSDNQGNFSVNNLPLGVPLRLVATHSGYTTYREEFTLSDSAPNKNFGIIDMTTLASNMEEVIVLAERPPVLVRKDTVEFNAASFKTLPNAVVEDLLKKLPGVNVDRDGNITVGGKQVNRILVDGKSFFGSDPKMASRNLPAQTIDKIQVVDDIEELKARGDDNRSQVGKVINLTFKKGYKKGMFGKAYAGAGTDSRYEAGLITNVFKDTLQVSLLGYTNNLNKPGFTGSDLMQTGGISRSSSLAGSRSMSSNNSLTGSNISINGINFGGMSNQGGVSASTGGGFNLNHSPSDKRSFYLQYFYGYVDTRAIGATDNKTSFGDTVLNRIQSSNRSIFSNSHVANVGFKLKPDTLTTWLGEINYTNGVQDNLSNRLQNAHSNFVSAINSGNVQNNQLNHNQFMKEGVEFTRLSRTKKGRRFSINQQVQYNDRKNDYTTLADLDFYYPTAYDSLMHQLRLEKIPQLNAWAGATYSEPLNKTFTLRVSGRYEYEKLKNNISTYNLLGGGKTYMSLLSDGFNRSTNKGSLSTGLEWKYQELRIRPGLRFLSQSFRTQFTNMEEPFIQKQNNILPQLNIQYKNLNIDYNRNVNLPGYQYFIAVQDNTNPYIIQKGNTTLLPTVSDDIYMNYNNYDTKRNLNIWSWASASFVNNDVIQSIQLNSDGVQVISAVNANGTKKLGANYGFTKDYKTTPKFTWTWNIGGYTQYVNNKFLYNGTESRQKTLYNNNWGFVNVNWADKFEFNTNFGIGIRSTKNTNSYFKKFTSIDNMVGLEAIDRHVKHFIFETQLNYSYNNAIQDPNYQKYWLWRAAVNYTFLKDERGVLKLSAFDILNQVRDADIYTNQNQVIFSTNNTLQRYFMLSFTYNMFAAGAKKKVGGQWNLW